MNMDFEERFEEMARRVSAQDQEDNKSVRVFSSVAKTISVLAGFCAISLVYSAGVKLVAFGLQFSLGLLDAWFIGLGLTTMQLAHGITTWSRK